MAGSHGPLEMGVVLNHQRRRGAARKHLHGADPWLAFQRRQPVNVGLGARHVQADIAPATTRHVAALPRQALGIGDWRNRVGHVEQGGDPAEDRGPRAGLDRFHGWVAGITQVDVAVDQAGQDVQAYRVDHRIRGRADRRTEIRDPPGADAEIDPLGPPRRDAGAAADQEVVVHRRVLPKEAVSSRTAPRAAATAC